ncbi:MAG TPA: succinate dehydrogenase cytochrome b subunit, partial [candidate division Zixibacteria bacterium]|nr:succinate dehydrogenase cytochrome b subunit [candidate division Zixibacteria bacterium]
KSLGPILWVGRLALLAFFLTHIWVGLRLTLQNKASRMGGYQRAATVKASLASRTMIYSGALILIFVVYHVLHFTAHTIDERFASLVDAAGRPDVYTMVVMGFSDPVNSLSYIAIMVLVGAHISHGIYSMFQTMGLNAPSFEPKLTRIAWALTIVIVLGFVAAPLGVMTGAVQLTPETLAQVAGGLH